MGKIKFTSTTGISNKKFDDWINWWSLQTKNNENTLDLEPAEIRNNVIFAVFASINGQVIGAAGLMLLPDNPETYFRGKLVVEFRANCVQKEFERNHIGTTLHNMRIQYVDAHELNAVMITKENVILHISKKFRWRHISKIKNSHGLELKLRKCLCHHNPDKPFVGERCPTCPYFRKRIFLRLCKKT